MPTLGATPGRSRRVAYGLRRVACGLRYEEPVGEPGVPVLDLVPLAVRLDGSGEDAVLAGLDGRAVGVRGAQGVEEVLVGARGKPDGERVVDLGVVVPVGRRADPVVLAGRGGVDPVRGLPVGADDLVGTR